MRIKSSCLILTAFLCAAQLGLIKEAFALPQVEDAGDVLPSGNNNAGYLSSTPVQAPEITAPVTQKSGNINDDLLAKIRVVEDEVQSLKGQMDELQHSLQQSQKEQAVLMEALSKKISAMPVAVPAAIPVAKAATSVKTPPVAAIAAVTKTVPAITPEAQEKATYDAAYGLVSAKAYADAIEAFKGHLTIYPDGKYVPQANYWLGELHASQQLYPEAIRYLEVVVKQYPNSSKVPDAMLKLGIINKRLGNDAKAQTWFARVIQDYPQTPSAQSAKEYIVN